MHNLSRQGLIAAAAVAALAAAGCAGGGQVEQKPDKPALFQPGSAIGYQKYGKDYPATTVKDVPGPCSYESISRKDYSGQTLKIITHAVPVIGEPTKLHAKQFEELTGAKVEVVNVPFGELHQKILTPLQAGQPAYDVMFYPSLWIGDMAPYLAPVPKEYLDTPGMKDVTKAFMGVATWNGTVVQYPVDGDRHYLKIRTDVLKDPKQQAAYKAATGRDLEVPKTWAEYAQVASFFTGKDFDGDGKPNFGSAEVTKRDDLMFSAFISRAAPYVKNPGVKGGVFFDVETMQPLINTPGFVRALDDMVKAKSAWPPGGANFGLGDEIFSFGGGQTLMSYSWDDAFIQAQQPDSRVRNKVEAAPLPGSDEVYNRTTKAWDKTPNQAPYFTWGWTSAVAKTARNQKMAFDYLCFFSNEANTALDLTIGRFGVNPYRNSHFDAAFWEKQGWDKDTAEAYVRTLSDMEKSTNRVFDLRVPGVNEYMSSLANGVAAALAGQKAPQQALDDVAREWTDITGQIGKDKVQAAYRNVVALEDNS
ncbi:extracellular solute-binding protein [Planotetraspora sp. A-T 1434]|uniref:extracellular solute-binding protein n=1 Tax=Planotetraspora sp. A-T 1434 TaxID=2979219 RepID=UPI0021C18CD5|nr:extracellular solute-binding protein [Planotetraspora sp. A-T 1434]MCT9928974.1 extracellular solute-binding protein [Planotetraspora sp. A-T 1434]